MTLERFPVRHQPNPHLDRARPYGAAEREILSEAGLKAAREEITHWPGYGATPLIALPGLADALGVGAIHYKDEGKRFGLKSFKALGGAYAVLVLLQDHVAHVTGHRPPAEELICGAHADRVGPVTVATATDGNHGRSVAWGASMFGCRAIVYLHGHVSATREREIARFGCTIARVEGSYDDSVRQCAADAAAHGWLLVADTSLNGGRAVPSLVMQGYAVMVDEIMADTAVAPTHIFVPGAVGGLAAAVVATYWERQGAQRPRIVLVEPFQADCVSRSLAAGALTAVPGDVNTFMACLAAGEVSPVAWDILGPALDDAIAIPDEAAMAAMRLLARGVTADPPLISGESGCAATAGLIAAAQDPDVAQALRLDRDAQLVVIGTEGATDVETYRRVVGPDARVDEPEEVAP